MSPRNTYVSIFAALVGLLAVLAFTVWLGVRTHERLGDSETRRYESNKLAEELRRSSDDLTRMARTYVVTGDPIYEQYFWDILAIRNGEQARPANYDSIYWDRVVARKQRPPAVGSATALKDLMRKLQFSEQEFRLLEEAQDRSDALVQLETEAMNAVKGKFDDGSGEYRLEKAPDMELARSLLHGDEYHAAKAGIMQPIADFLRLVEQRTAREVESLRKDASRYNWIALALAALTALFAVFGYAALKRRLSSPTDHIAKRAEPRDRLKVLGYSLVTMALIAVIVGTVAIYSLYQTAFEQQGLALMETVDAQVRLIEAVARFDRIHSQDANVGGGAAATLSQIVDAHRHHQGIGETGEFTLARLEGDTMVFLLDRRHDDSGKYNRISFKGSPLAEPMRRALSGETGTTVASDYRGQRVLAAYEPVGELDLGIVA
ncbi:MAG: hypothetical protein O7F76_06405, partial [Planctomycetota bacterium]|nr:hypothetical protein [Planctomycetota bacterium]